MRSELLPPPSGSVAVALLIRPKDEGEPRLGLGPGQRNQHRHHGQPALVGVADTNAHRHRGIVLEGSADPDEHIAYVAWIHPLGEQCADDGARVVTEHLLHFVAQSLDPPVLIDGADQEGRIEIIRRTAGVERSAGLERLQHVRWMPGRIAVVRGEKDQGEIAPLGVVDTLRAHVEFERGTGRCGQGAREVVAVDQPALEEIETFPALLPVRREVIGPFDGSDQSLGCFAPGDHPPGRKVDRERQAGWSAPRRRATTMGRLDPDPFPSRVGSLRPEF